MAASAADPFATGYDEISKIIFSLVYFFAIQPGLPKPPDFGISGSGQIPAPAPTPTPRPRPRRPPPTPPIFDISGSYPTPTQIDLQDKDNLQRLSVADY